MPLLFSYGTLQQEDVQRATFGRLLNGEPDQLPGFALSQHLIYANVIPSESSHVAGTVYELTDADLEAADRFEEDAAYRRIEVDLASGKRAWVYVAPPPPPRFGAAKAIAIIALTFVAQTIIGAIVAIIGYAIAAARGANLRSPAAVRALTNAMAVPLVIASVIASAVVIVWLTRLWALHLLRDKSDAGLGWRGAPGRTIVLAAVAGFAISVTYAVLARVLFPARPGTPLGPLTTMAVAGGFGRVIWAIVALVIAPPLEEFLFRGLFLRGLMTSWGPAAAYTTVTVVFVSFHLFETYRYLPALIGISALATAALIARVKSGSLAPAIALHASYNLVLVIWAYAA